MAEESNQIPNSPANRGKIEFARPGLQPVLKFPPQLYNFKIQALIIAILVFVFYSNTFQNEAAFDDELVISKNEYVLEGLAGLPGILTGDTYENYYRQYNMTNQLSGGRYRPLSLVTFAIEQQFFGAIPKDQISDVVQSDMTFAMDSPYERQFNNQMHVRHVFNVIWFAFSAIVLLYFLRYIVLKKDPLVALFAVVIFVIHPVHTEVVANVKSRDEILSLLFICLTFIFAFKYRELKKKSLLVQALGSYFLALLSKEYAVTLVVLLPLAFYLFDYYSLKKSIRASLSYFAVLSIYLFIRFLIVYHEGVTKVSDGLNSPQAYTSNAQKIATEISTSVRYLKLLFFPYPLSSDYSYNTIPGTDFSNPIVWLCIILYMVMAGLFVYFLRKRSSLTFALAFYLLNLLLVSNIIFDVGTTMSERLIYHSSVSFAIVVAWLLYKGIEKIRPERIGKMALASIVLTMIVLSGFETIKRNAEWKNNFTLFLHDIKVVPNSSLVNGNAASAMLKMGEAESDSTVKNEYYRKSVFYFDKSIALNKMFYALYVNRSYLYFLIKQPDSSLADLNTVKELHPSCPKLAHMYFNVGVLFYKSAQYAKALTAWKSAVELEPDYSAPKNSIDILYNYNLVPR